MPLTKEQQQAITEIAALCGNQQDKEALARILAENDNVRGGFLRQSDYSRRMNEISVKEKELADSKKRYDDAFAANKKWRDEEVMPKLQRVTDLERENRELQTKYQEAAAKINAGNGEGNVTPEEVKALVDEKIKAMGGQVTPENITTMVNDIVAKGRQEFIDQTLPLQTNFAMDMSEIAYQNLNEFGKPLDREAFSKFCQERNFVKPKEAYEEFVRPERDKANEAKTRKEIEEQVRKELSASAGLPGSGAVPTGEMGVVQQRLQAARTAQAGQGGGGPQVVPGGAAAAAAELRASGKV